jgi:hypothetical protein
MQCPKCGWNNPDDAAKCANCFAEIKAAGPPQPTQQMPQPPQQPYPQQPQQPYPQQPYAQQPYAPGAIPSVPDYLVWSIVLTVISLFCCACLPVSVAFGIVAIVKSSQANSKKMLGDYFGALQEANAAKTWLYWAAGLDLAGLIASIIYFFLAFAAGFGGAMHHQY